MATYVLVHGGGHGGWCWKPVATRLRAAGHEVLIPTVTGLAERSHFVRPGIDLDTHITDVVKVLEFEDLHDVILVGHSYGGMVITGVADRVTEWPMEEMGRFYGVEDPDALEWMQRRLAPHPWACFEEKVQLADEDAVSKLPRPNINCTQSLRTSEPDALARQLDGDRNWEIDTGHDLMITEPDAVAEMLLRVAEHHGADAT